MTLTWLEYRLVPGSLRLIRLGEGILNSGSELMLVQDIAGVHQSRSLWCQVANGVLTQDHSFHSKITGTQNSPHGIYQDPECIGRVDILHLSETPREFSGCYDRNLWIK